MTIGDLLVVMKYGILFPIAVLGFERLCANPIVFDPQEAHLRLVGEDVRVSVGKRVAKLDGVYEFTLMAEAFEPKDKTYYRLQLPLYCDSVNRRLTTLMAEYRPKLSIGNVEYEFSSVDTFLLPDQSETHDLTGPMICFQTKIPRSVGSRFVAHISYDQPYLKVKEAMVFAYLPIIFDAPKSSSPRRTYQLRLVAERDLAVDPKSGRWERAGTTFIFECRHFQEILVAVLELPNETL